MRSSLAWPLTWGAIFGLVFHGSLPAVADTPIVTIDECRNLSDTEVRDRIRELASTSLKTEFAAVDYPALVNLYWAKARVNERIDREVDDAIAAVRANSSWFERAYSTVSQSSAERYATAVADRAYNSEGFKAAIGEMAAGVAKEAGAQIEKATARVASPVIACVKTALQSRYGGAIAQVFSQESQKNLENGAADLPAVKIESSDLLVSNAASISGIVLIVTRRVIAKVVQTAGERVAGMVASRIVSSIAGLVGLALIAKDIYDAGEGVFPIIAERMKSDETKTLIKDEIGKSIKTDINQQVEAIAQETAERIYAVWLDFKQKYNRLLLLSEKSPAFAQFLKDRRFDQLNKLGVIVDIVYASEGEKGVLSRVEDGSLNRALLDLTDAGLAIASDQKSLDIALRWSALAGNDLPKVVDLGLYRWLSPDSLTRENLQKILSLNDKVAVGRIAGLDPKSRNLMLGLPTERLRNLARRLTDQQLAAFADYESRLDAAPARRLLRAVSEDARVMEQLSGPGLKEAILSSRDQGAALDMALHEDSGLISYGRILKDAELVRAGSVGYRVFWERYWPSILVAGFVLILLLSWLRRLLFGRQAVIIREERGSRRR